MGAKQMAKRSFAGHLPSASQASADPTSSLFG